MGYKINEYGEIISPNAIENITQKSVMPKSPKVIPFYKKWLIIGIIIVVMIGSCSAVGYQCYRRLQTKDSVLYGFFANKEDAIEFITGYYKAVINGNCITYFADKDITFFDLVRVDRTAVEKRISKSNKNVDWDFDWSTLKMTVLSSGTTIAVYSFDYYIHYKTRTDKYHITSEMVINLNRKIQSIRDLETIKLN